MHCNQINSICLSSPTWKHFSVLLSITSTSRYHSSYLYNTCSSNIAPLHQRRMYITKVLIFFSRGHIIAMHTRINVNGSRSLAQPTPKIGEKATRMYIDSYYQIHFPFFTPLTKEITLELATTIMVARGNEFSAINIYFFFHFKYIYFFCNCWKIVRKKSIVVDRIFFYLDLTCFDTRSKENWRLRVDHEIG